MPGVLLYGAVGAAEADYGGDVSRAKSVDVVYEAVVGRGLAASNGQGMLQGEELAGYDLVELDVIFGSPVRGRS